MTNSYIPTVPDSPSGYAFNEKTANRDWTYWQYDHRGKVAGIRGDVDLNAFYGNRKQWNEHLRQFAK